MPKKRVIFLLLKKTFIFGCATFDIFLTKSMKKQNSQFTHFSYIFQVVVDCG